MQRILSDNPFHKNNPQCTSRWCGQTDGWGGPTSRPAFCQGDAGNCGAHHALCLTLCMLGNFCMLFCRLLEFFSQN